MPPSERIISASALRAKRREAGRSRGPLQSQAGGVRAQAVALVGRLIKRGGPQKSAPTADGMTAAQRPQSMLTPTATAYAMDCGTTTMAPVAPVIRSTRSDSAAWAARRSSLHGCAGQWEPGAEAFAPTGLPGKRLAQAGHRQGSISPPSAPISSRKRTRPARSSAATSGC